MYKEFILEGLGCANCAAKMEDKISKLEYVSEVSINFATKKLMIETKENPRDLLDTLTKIVQKIESHVVVVEKMKKKKANKQQKQNESCCGDHHDEQGQDACCSVHVHKHEGGCCGGHDHAHDHEHSHEDSHEHSHEHDHHDHSHENLGKKDILTLSVGIAVFAVAMLFKFSFWTEFTLYLIAYLFVGKDILITAFKNVGRGQLLDENFLMTIASISAFAIQEFSEAVAVIIFFRIGELFESNAINRSRKSIETLLDIRPDFANLKTKEGLKKISPEDVSVGDVIIVKPGEKIPLDGHVINGESMLDTAVITGESVLRIARVGDEVFSGTINKNGVLTIEVTKEFEESTVSKILELVEKAGNKKAEAEKFITKFAKYYTPAVVAVAALLAVIPPIFIEGAHFSEWIYRAAIFLVVSCPCALVISIPLGFFGGIGGASRAGVLVKGGNYLEALNKVDTVIFDKTGTLTKGVFEVTKIKSVGNLTADKLVEYAAYVENYSNHPIAVSICKAYGKEIDESVIENYEEISGHGIQATIKGKEVLAGNSKMMEKYNIDYKKADGLGTTVYISVDGRYEGYIIIADEIKEDTAKGIKELKKIGVQKVVMLTGDQRGVAEAVAKEVGIDEFYAELLPHEKVEKFEQIQKSKNDDGKILFVGDGINDAPVLARADVGVAMGGLGSDAAIEAADVVLMTDEISKLSTSIKIARKTKQIVWQNIVFALGVKGIVLVLGAAGMATMWAAVFADVGVAVIAILNSIRVIKNK